MILTQKNAKSIQKKLSKESDIKSIVLTPETPAVWKHNNGYEQPATCLSCIDQPCISYKQEELKFSELNDFARDQTTNICATNAIDWPSSSDYPVINEDQCINCGLCAERCPAKAIYLTEKSAVVNFSSLLENTENIDEHYDSLNHLKAAVISGNYLIPSQNSCVNSIEKINQLKVNENLGDNLLIRNILQALGVKSAAYRQGVQYSTVDIVGVYNGDYLAVEVELDNSLIDTPRNLITSAAILYERHNWDKSNTKFLSVGLRFPNKREEFWNVIEDIDQILNIKINFATVLSLFFLIWLRKPFKIEKNQYFIHKNNKKNIRGAIGTFDELNYISKGYLGILESEK